MDHIYLLCVDGAEWEDIVVYTTLESALEKSRAWPNTRLEIFSKSDKGGYRPTYNYYLNGLLVQTNLPTE
jgi:hypothetical protein